RGLDYRRVVHALCRRRLQSARRGLAAIHVGSTDACLRRDCNRARVRNRHAASTLGRDPTAKQMRPATDSGSLRRFLEANFVVRALEQKGVEPIGHTLATVARCDRLDVTLALEADERRVHAERRNAERRSYRFVTGVSGAGQRPRLTPVPQIRKNGLFPASKTRGGIDGFEELFPDIVAESPYRVPLLHPCDPPERAFDDRVRQPSNDK